MVKQLQLDQIINQNVHVFKIHNPYYESDHVLNIAYNILCQGDCLEDIERLRNDEAYPRPLPYHSLSGKYWANIGVAPN